VQFYPTLCKATPIDGTCFMKYKEEAKILMAKSGAPKNIFMQPGLD
jgi:hypothetical protein